MIAVGKIVRPHGIRGEVKVIPLIVNPEQFCEFTSLSIERKQGRAEWIDVEEARVQNQRIILKLSGVETRDQAELLRDILLRLPREDCPECRVESSDSIDLIGFKAKTVDGIMIGSVVDILQKSVQNILVVESAGKEIMIPDVGAFVKTVDRARRFIIIDPIEGLLD